jgi:hypothetical protein
MDLNFTIGDKTYYIPERASVEQFERSIQWDPNQQKNWKPFVSTLTGAPLRDLDLLEEDTFHFILGSCINAVAVERGEPEPRIMFRDLQDLEELSFGQFIDIDLYITVEPLRHIGELIAIAYDAEAEEVRRWRIDKVWSTFLWLSDWRKQVYREFDGFFELEGKEETGNKTGQVKLTQLHKMWYDIIMVLADEKFLNIDPVVNRPWREALNWLTWKKNKVAEEKLEILKKKNDLQRTSR